MRCTPHACSRCLIVGLSAALLWFAPGLRAAPIGTGLNNACLPEALIMEQALRDGNIRAKVLLVQYREGRHKRWHAVTVFPFGRQLLTWDSKWGSLPFADAKDFDKPAAWLGKAYISKRIGKEPLVFVSACVGRIDLEDVR